MWHVSIFNHLSWPYEKRIHLKKLCYYKMADIFINISLINLTTETPKFYLTQKQSFPQFLFLYVFLSATNYKKIAFKSKTSKTLKSFSKKYFFRFIIYLYWMIDTTHIMSFKSSARQFINFKNIEWITQPSDFFLIKMNTSRLTYFAEIESIRYFSKFITPIFFLFP